MNMRAWKIDETATVGERFLVTGVRPRYAYSEGKRTDAVIGHRVDCVCIDRGYCAISVAVPGARTIGDDAVANNAGVRFTGLAARPYTTDGGKPALAWSADSVTIIKG